MDVSWAFMCPREHSIAALNRVSETNIIPATKATRQMDGFPNAFMLGTRYPASADCAYEQFQADGILPTHSRGLWVVFIG